MAVERRVSATYKDLPGGQLLGPTFDYTHRLLDPDLRRGSRRRAGPQAAARRGDAARLRDACARRPDRGRRRPAGEQGTGDITREPLDFPIGRDVRLQALSRGDEGFLLALGYSTQRGYGRSHPFVGEVRIGMVELELDVPELPFPVSRSAASASPNARWSISSRAPPRRRRNLPAATAWCSANRSARRWRWRCATGRCAPASWARSRGAPAQDEEFVISHADNVQATGFVEHLKLPHYVDFQAELDLVRRMRAEHEAREIDAAKAGDEGGRGMNVTPPT